MSRVDAGPNTREWDISDRFVSNEGRGPLICRILSWCDGELHLEYVGRYTPGGKKNARFVLTEKFWTSRRCGWRRLRARASEDRRGA